MPDDSKALNDDLSSKFDDRINSTDKQLLDCPVNANMASGLLDNLVIVCLCYLSYHQILMRGHRLGPNGTILSTISQANIPS